MRLPELPHPHLIWLRSAATLLLSCLIGQAGWAAANLGGQTQYAVHHQVGAWVTLVVALLTAVVYVVLRRSAGPVNLGLSLVTALAVVVQVWLGEAGGHRALHIFLGVLLAMLGTALTSWTYRHRMPDPVVTILSCYSRTRSQCRARTVMQRPRRAGATSSRTWADERSDVRRLPQPGSADVHGRVTGS